MLSGYDSLELTGHSLGGNLAEYATIISDQYGLNHLITKCTALDSPGFSIEFFEIHLEQIQRMSPVMTHYTWSVVGNCLWEPAQTRIKAQVNDANNPLDVLERHDMKHLVFNEDGSIKTSSGLNLFSGDVVYLFSQSLDVLPPEIKMPLGFVVKRLLVGGVFLGNSFGFGISWLKDEIIHFFGGSTEQDALNQIERNAKAEAALSDSFQIDPLAFIEMGNSADRLIQSVDSTISVAGRGKGMGGRLIARNALNMADGVVNPFEVDSRLRALRKKIMALAEALEKCESEMKGCRNVVSGVRNYLLQTGIDFTAAEKEAVNRIKGWSGNR